MPTTKRKAKKKRTLGIKADAFVRRLHNHYGMSPTAMDGFCHVVEKLRNKKNRDLSVVRGLKRVRVDLLCECKTTYTRWKLSDELQALHVFRMSETQFIVSRGRCCVFFLCIVSLLV